MAGDAPTFYGSVDDAAAYHLARNNAAWAAASPSPDPWTPALIRASVYIDGRFRGRFPGRRTAGRAQLLEWPRCDARDSNRNRIPDDEVPVEILSATYEAALRELTSPGSLSPVVVGSERVASEKVGEIEVHYAAPSSLGPDDVRPVVTVIDDLLSGLLVQPTAGGVVFLDRA